MIGTKLSDRYEILSELGRGGMGVVYKANDPMLGREVAIKVIAPSLMHDEADQRFRSEARAVAKLDHPSLVPIHDIGEHERSLYFVMPVLQGQSLRHHLRNQTLTLGDILDGAIQVSEALEYTHARNILHRDLKPENLMVSKEEGGGIRFRLMDFGLAKDVNTSRVTRTGVVVGTMGYMSPEQVTGAPCDGRSDIYSLATVIYECLTGELPFSGEMQSILYRIVHEIPQSPRAMGIDMDEELEAVVLQCLAKKPEERVQKASELTRALRRYREHHRESEKMLTVMATAVVHGPKAALSPFVGREKEIKELQLRLNAAKAGECQFVAVAGDAGIGKTRLLDELETLARAQQIPVLHGRFMEQDGAFPYHGFCELIQDHFRQKESGSSSSASDLTELGSDLVALFPMLSEIQDIRSVAMASSPSVDSEATRLPENKNQIFELLARTLTRLAGGKPLVLVLEDLHGAEISIEALQYIVRRLGPTSTLILGTYRPSELDRRDPLSRMLDSLQGDPRFALISLGPLTAGEHDKLLTTLLGGKKIDRQLAKQLYEGSEGNPFFAKELVRSLLDSESIAEDATGTWRLSGVTGVGADDLPDTIQQAVEKRVAGLPDGMIAVLSTAAVMGKTFDFDHLEALLGGQDDLDDMVDRLVQEGLIEEERRSRGDVMTFSSGVVREVLYAKLSRRKRRSLHRKFAELLEKKHAGRLERVYPQLVYHYAEGDEPGKTVEYGLLHAAKSLESFSPEEAIRAAATSLEFLDDEWEGDRALEGDARMLLAQGHQMRGEIAEGLRQVEAAIAVYEREGKSRRVVRSILTASRMAWQARRVEEAQVWVERGMVAARQTDDPENLAEFLSLAGTLANLRAEYGKANDYLQEAERLRAGTQDPDEKAEVPEGGRLVVPFINPISSVDPAAIGYDDQVEIAANIFETLLTTDGEGRLAPTLCESWEARDGGRSFVFTLREGIRFHDGEPLTAPEVKRNFEETVRLRGEEMRAGLSVIEGVEEFLSGGAPEIAGIVAHSPGNLEIRLSEPLPIYPALLTEINMSIARGDAGGADRTVGTGPFRMVSQEPDRIVLERNSGYRGTVPRIEVLEFRPGQSASAIADGLRSGDLDMAQDLPAADLEVMMRDPRFRGRMAEIPGKHTFFVLFNVHGGPMAANLDLRRALTGIVQVRDLVWQTKGQFAEPAASLLPPGLLGHDPGRRRRVMSLEDARDLIRRVSADPIKLSVAVSPGNMDRHGGLIKALFSLWSKAGVDTEVVTPTLGIYNEKSAHPEGIDLFLVGWISDYDDPDAFTHELFNSHTGRYRKLFSTPMADELLQKARAEIRPEVRVALYRQFENLLDEQGTVLPLFHQTNYRIPGPRVRGFTLKASPPYVNYAELGKSEEEVSPTEVAATGGGTIRVPIRQKIAESLDPRVTTHVDEAEIVSCVFETLTRVADGARVIPWLASRIDVEDSGKRYRFKLREGLRSHDGRRITTRDVRFTMERVLGSETCEHRLILSPIRGAGAIIGGEKKELEGFSIHSSTEFSIQLEKPYPFFPAVLSHLGIAIVPEDVDFGAGNFRDGLGGTGPFRVVRYDPGGRIEMERNPNYWRSGYPRPERIVFEAVEGNEETYTGFRRGRFSLAYNLDPEQFEELRRSPDFAGTYKEVPSLSAALIALNTQRGPLEDGSLRRRFAAAIDRQAMVKAIQGASPVVARGIIPPGLLGYNPGSGSSSRVPVGGDGGGSGRSGGAGGEDGGGEVTLTLATSPSIRTLFGQAIDLLISDLASVGIHLEFLPITSRDEFSRFQAEGAADLLLGAWVADYPDTHAMVAGILDSREGYAGRFCGSPELDRMIHAAQVEIDPGTRHGLYRRIEELLEREAMIVPLFYVQIYRFARPEVQGLSLSFSPPDVKYEDLWIST